ncbi:hypothetical protein [Tabrizicola sp.]|uniref:hypothetical protein n=1 Tax=Tabrizicola sp. TaxID=2005166 RepID=UPI00286D369C|nr:hypothetical protein [Tabrizicola sp.]
MRKIDQRVADFTGSGANGRRSAALLDMAAVWADLGAAGFHSGTRKIAGAADWLRRGGLEPFAWDDVSASLLATRPKMTWLEQSVPTGIVPPDTP